MEFKNTHYFGGKSGPGTYQKIINQIPVHKYYIELFGGMVGIFRHKSKAKYSFVIEPDLKLIDFYQKELDFKREWELNHFLKPLEMGGYGNYCYMGSAFDFFNHQGFSALVDRENVFIYADPPYPLMSRKDSRPQYKYELSDDEHRELIHTLCVMSYAKVAISTYPNELYDEEIWGKGWGDRWRRIEFESQTRHGKATEQLWMNYEEPDQLHDYRYIGKDYRERERIARQQRNWRRKFKDLPVIEQRAMLQSLKTTLDPTGTYGDTS